MTSKELMPCPFCGKTPKVSDGTYSGSAIHVSCRCGAQLFGGRNHFSSEEEAVSSWNHRQQVAAIKEPKELDGWTDSTDTTPQQYQSLS